MIADVAEPVVAAAGPEPFPGAAAVQLGGPHHQPKPQTDQILPPQTHGPVVQVAAKPPDDRQFAAMILAVEVLEDAAASTLHRTWLAPIRSTRGPTCWWPGHSFWPTWSRGCRPS